MESNWDESYIHEIMKISSSHDYHIYLVVGQGFHCKSLDVSLTLLHSELPKLHRVLAVLSAIGLIR